MDFMILSTPMVSWESHGIKSRKISLYHNMVIGGKDLSHDIMINDNKITRPNKKKPRKNLDPDKKTLEMDFTILSTPIVSWESHGIKSRKISLYVNRW